MLKNNHTYLIAEIGWNFIGNLNLAKKMIDSAKKSGADFVKFQIWNPTNLKKGEWDNDGRKEIYKKAFLDKKKFKTLYEYSNKKKIKCFASIFAETELEDYLSITKEFVKIPSHEAYNLNLINQCIKKFKFVFISCGCLKHDELKKLINLTKSKKNVILMHCVSSYPLTSKNCNFNKFDYLKKSFSKVGYSGHYHGIEDALFAIEKGAVVIEKHFTTSNNLPGRDNKFALLPKDLEFLSGYIKKKKEFQINNGLGLQKCEKDIYRNYRGRWSK